MYSISQYEKTILVFTVLWWLYRQSAVALSSQLTNIIQNCIIVNRAMIPLSPLWVEYAWREKSEAQWLSIWRLSTKTAKATNAFNTNNYMSHDIR